MILLLERRGEGSREAHPAAHVAAVARAGHFLEQSSAERGREHHRQGVEIVSGVRHCAEGIVHIHDTRPVALGRQPRGDRRHRGDREQGVGDDLTDESPFLVVQPLGPIGERVEQRQVGRVVVAPSDSGETYTGGERLRGVGVVEGEGAAKGWTVHLYVERSNCRAGARWRTRLQRERVESAVGQHAR